MSDIGSVTYDSGVAITPSDTATLSTAIVAALQATTAAGTAKVTTLRGQTLTIYLPLGVIIPVAVKQVFATGTSATGIVGLCARTYSGQGL